MLILKARRGLVLAGPIFMFRRRLGSGMAEALLDIEFDGGIIAWRGPSPFVFATIPEEYAGEIRYAARIASYGWGVVPVLATIGATAFRTSLFPRAGSYLLPLKVVVQRATALAPGDRARIRLRVENGAFRPPV